MIYKYVDCILCSLEEVTLMCPSFIRRSVSRQIRLRGNTSDFQSVVSQLSLSLHLRTMMWEFILLPLTCDFVWRFCSRISWFLHHKCSCRHSKMLLRSPSFSSLLQHPIRRSIMDRKDKISMETLVKNTAIITESLVSYLYNTTDVSRLSWIMQWIVASHIVCLRRTTCWTLSVEIMAFRRRECRHGWTF